MLDRFGNEIVSPLDTLGTDVAPLNDLMRRACDAGAIEFSYSEDAARRVLDEASRVILADGRQILDGCVTAASTVGVDLRASRQSDPPLNQHEGIESEDHPSL